MIVIQWAKEFYLSCFVFSFRMGINRWSRPVEINKAVACVTLGEFFAIIGMSAWIEMYRGEQFPKLPSWCIVIAYFALCFVNYYVLVYRGYGVAFEHQFNHLKKATRVRLLVSFLVAVIAILVFFIFSGTAYRRYFHISSG